MMEYASKARVKERERERERERDRERVSEREREQKREKKLDNLKKDVSFLHWKLFSTPGYVINME